ncbi:MAG: PSD1 domain-containing protein, partial [Verrucomicrobiae bacterium]|nr:PSD1 domain-containing protein [Verrucomicrobiae bacterium]
MLLPSRPSAAPVDFSRDVLPVLSDHCFACHGPDAASRKAGLRLDTLDGARSAGKSGTPAIVPGSPEQSAVWRRLETTDSDEVMPPPESKRSLTPAQRERIRTWIQEGASWGRHWAYEAPRRGTPPQVPGAVNPVDAFVRARLAAEGLQPSPEAPRSVLIRRLSLDLTGLPPSPETVAAFESDAAPDAYERWVDRLLASPRFGERMAWEWMEAARYSDSNGYQGDGERTMWPWRDWVVSALNRNLPFDRFSVWQLAGDLIPDAPAEARLATGFLRNHMINGEGGRISEENRIDYLFDQTETVATVWLAATYNCTRCHDHKYDPHTQRDYFALMAFFNRTAVDGSGGNPQTPPVIEVPSEAQVRRRNDLESSWNAAVEATVALESRRSEERQREADGWPAEVRELIQVSAKDRDVAKLEKLAGLVRERDPAHADALDHLRGVRADRDALSRAIPRVMVMEDIAEPRTNRLLHRGSYLQAREEVTMALPVSLADGAALSVSNRLGLARWLLAPENPLTARVIVNRWWQSLFGVGLVKTSEDFGLQSERPSHPELLDWLACELVESGWDAKRLIRQIVTSATYRQSSVVGAELAELDPENRLLARGPRFRMPSWMMRDAALCASGLLVETAGGPPVKPYQPPGIWEEATFGNKRYEQDHGADLYRRSLYVFWRRIAGPAMFFDVGSRQTCTVRTPRTNVPLHALLTLNDPAYLEAARMLSESILADPGATDADRLSRVY